MANVLLLSRLSSTCYISSIRSSRHFFVPNLVSRNFLSTSSANFTNESSIQSPQLAAVNTAPPSPAPVNDVSSAISSPSSSPSELDLTQFLSDSTIGSAANVLQHVGPLTAADLDLTWWLPTGLFFQVFEFLNSYFPAWGSIAIFTLCARTIILSRLISNQRFSAKASYWMPDIILAQKKLQKAIASGNQSDIARVMQEAPDVQEKQMSLLKNSFLTAAIQMPIFLSAYHVLSGYAKIAAPEFKTGGLSWFSDLTVPDPYYILPTYMALSLYAIFKSGVEFGNASNAYANPMVNKVLFIGMPMVTFATAIWMHWPASLLLYWCFNNSISVLQVNLLRQPGVKKFFKIPESRKFDLNEVRGPQKSFKESIAEMREGLRVARDFNAREATARAFEKAGVDPPKKTTKIDFTKIQPPK